MIVPGDTLTVWATVTKKYEEKGTGSSISTSASALRGDLPRAGDHRAADQERQGDPADDERVCIVTVGGSGVGAI